MPRRHTSRWRHYGVTDAADGDVITWHLWPL